MSNLKDISIMNIPSLDINETKDDDEDIIDDGLQTTCLKCDKSFKTLEKYKYHFRMGLCKSIGTKKKSNNKKGKRKNICDQCGKVFRYIIHLNNHMEGHAANNCRLCPQLITNRKALAIHLFEKHQIRLNPKSKVKCKYCDEEFIDKLHLHMHYRDKHKPEDKQHVCLQCGIFLPDDKSLEKHREEQHVAWTCDRCPKTFTRMQQYLVHLETHNKHKCPHCRERFASQSTLAFHISEVHQSTNNSFSVPTSSLHTCKICMKTFRRPSELKSHLRIHSGEKPWQCPLCSKDFHSFKAYSRHQITVGHKTALSRLRVLPCDLCSEIYQDQASLISHKSLVHGKSAPRDLLQCEHCGHRSVTMFNLRRHQRARHFNATPKRLIICEQCGDRFNNLAALKDHQLYRHSNSRDHVCAQCNKRFVRASCLNRHIKRHQNQQQKSKNKNQEAFVDQEDPLQSTQIDLCDDPMAVYLDPVSLLVDKEFLPDLANDIESNLNTTESELTQNILKTDLYRL